MNSNLVMVDFNHDRGVGVEGLVNYSILPTKPCSCVNDVAHSFNNEYMDSRAGMNPAHRYVVWTNDI